MGDYGISVESPKVNIDDMVKRSRDVASGMNKGINFLFKKNKVDHLKGFGKIISKGKVEVLDENGVATQYTTENIILATGGKAKELPSLPIDGVNIWGYRDAMVPAKQPKSIVIVGSGAIGIE